MAKFCWYLLGSSNGGGQNLTGTSHEDHACFKSHGSQLLSRAIALFSPRGRALQLAWNICKWASKWGCCQKARPIWGGTDFHLGPCAPSPHSDLDYVLQGTCWSMQICNDWRYSMWGDCSVVDSKLTDKSGWARSEVKGASSPQAGRTSVRGDSWGIWPTVWPQTSCTSSPNLFFHQ